VTTLTQSTEVGLIAVQRYMQTAMKFISTEFMYHIAFNSTNQCS